MVSSSDITLMKEEKTRRIIEDLKGIVGGKNVSTNMYERIANCVQLSHPERYVTFDKSLVPICVVRPISALEISEILKSANRENVAVYIRGRGTGYMLTCRPKRANAIILSLNRMNSLVIYEEEMYVEVGPATTTHQVNLALDPYGHRIPYFGAGWRVAHLGGAVSVNSSGHSIDAYTGKAAHYVLGLESVLPTGEIVDTGLKAWNSLEGHDLNQLFIGGEGLFGVITKLRIRIVPQPLNERHAWVFFRSLDDAIEAVKRMYQEKAPYPTYVELFDEKLTEEVYPVTGKDIPPGSSSLLVETDGYAEGEAERKMEEIIEIWRKVGALRWDNLDDTGWWKAFQSREKMGPRRTHLSMVTDPPLSKYVYAIRSQQAILKRLCSTYNVVGYCYGHIGGGTLHTRIWYPKEDIDEFREICREFKRETMELMLKLEASRSEQGNFPDWQDWFSTYQHEHYNALVKIKRVLDPNDILNPGNLEGEM